MRVLVIDDDEQFAGFLKREIVNNFEGIIDIDSIECIVANYLDFQYQSIDIAFIDIELKEYNGINLATKIRQLSPRAIFIFVSLYDDLVFDTLVTGVFHFIRKSNYTLDSQIVFKQLRNHLSSRKGKRIVTISGRSYAIELDKIEYLLSIGSEIIIHTQLKDYIVRASVKNILELLDYHFLVQIQRNQVINLDYVSSFLKNKVQMIDDSEYKIGRVFQKKFIERYKQYIFQNNM